MYKRIIESLRKEAQQQSDTVKKKMLIAAADALEYLEYSCEDLNRELDIAHLEIKSIEESHQQLQKNYDKIRKFFPYEFTVINLKNGKVMPINIEEE